MQQVLNLSVVIVTWNCDNFIERFMNELKLSLEYFQGYEILIYDNASIDTTVEKLKSYDVDILVSDTNDGFAIANNKLISIAKYNNIVLLNPDVFGFTPAFWQELLARWDNASPLFIRLLNEDGSFQNCVGDVLSLKRYARKIIGRVDFAAIDERCTVGMGIMAFMLTSKECLNNVGLLDEGFHMYSEDMDWCYRASRCGYQIIYEPKLTLFHLGGGSAAKRWDPLPAKLAKIKAERLFVLRHYCGITRFTLELLLIFKKVFHILRSYTRYDVT